ncbi:MULTISPECIES: Nudix family hydrolase [Nitrosomonas]|uniref:8-oxo-dGTP diphosphatase n=2 Tax=Nitrosomonas eutropha TaxID=916 RepID=A0ABX5M6Y6_9PROT|nr:MULTISPECIES: Nudix family hydrolase [Nitrosomonas]ABI58925.1 thiamine monophosphate synthase [Nitrosomonas eutropha C91]MXS79811.1 Nudix family hydrolase [Nitrosomonas sp. GH22]PXV77272.1 8-oxo-dGTP diphosphatase [Nitrosomonas eutropha]SEI82735.1 8-oxo-dGTP diphosphatase [Nitrosomonas eutropha]
MPDLPLVEVVVAILIRPDSSFLLTCRPTGKPYSGYWEFPGGKIETGESPVQALARELNEELGITPDQATPWLTRLFSYPHATVQLRFYRVTSWQGEPAPREQQQLAWQTADNVTVSPLLPANIPILRSLMLPSIYAITCAAETGVEASLLSIRQAFQSGIKLLQIREKAMPPDQLECYVQTVLQLARNNHQVTVLLNGNIALAQTVQADGIHLTSTQLLSLTARPTVNWCGASCHNAEELKRAEQLGVDFVTLSPVYPTLSHPGAPSLGWDKFSVLLRDYPLPVYALGGLQPTDLAIAQEHGAHGIAMMRGI